MPGSGRTRHRVEAGGPQSAVPPAVPSESPAVGSVVDVITVLVGLASALVYGSADFFGGLASKRVGPLVVIAISAPVGLAFALLLSLLIPPHVSADAVLWGALSSVAGSGALFFLYAALAIGPMSILSPLTAVISAIIPMVWGLLSGERLSGIGYAALGIALVAVVLVGFVPEKGAVRPRLRGVVFATISGFLIGVFLILFDKAPDDAGLVPLIANRTMGTILLGSTLLIVTLIARRRGRARGPAVLPVLPLIIAGGAADVIANTLILIALGIGELTIVSVLIALYPAGTIGLAAIVLHERIAPVQWVGLGLALVAAAMLALA